MSSPKHKPCSLLNVDHPTYDTYSGRRFTLAHELCHLLYDRSYGWQLAIASGPWAPRDLERRANAFAKTSPTATIEHLGNLGFLDEADRQRIRLEAERQLTSEESDSSG